MSEIEKLPDRKVAIPLGIGIFLMPYIFSWFTLRKGYSKTARAVSLAWLIFIPALLVISAAWEAVDPEGFKKASEEAEQSRLAEKAERQSAELATKSVESLDENASKSKETAFLAGTYRFFDNGRDDAQCNEDNDNKCANQGEWRKLCEGAGHVMLRAKQSSVDYTKEYSNYNAIVHLVENGELSNESIYFDQSSSPISACKISFEVSGVFTGTSYSRKISGHATEIFVRPASPSGPFIIVATSPD
jgi:hypothetical protein